MEARVIVEEFCNICAAMLTLPGLSSEIAYRIKKMMDSIAPIDDKVYLKTIKGKETLVECIEKAIIVKERLTGRDDLPYRLLTDLEMTCDDLLNQTYEFRIKAG